MTTDSAFKVSQLMAHVNSGISFFSDKMVCLKAPVSSNVATIANLNWTYYVELTVGDTTEVIDAKVGYNCPTGTATC